MKSIRLPIRRRTALMAIVCAAGLALATTSRSDLTIGEAGQLSVTSAGSTPNGASVNPSAGANAKNIVFASDASDLVSGDTNGYGDIFYRDRSTNALVRASVNTAGVEADRTSAYPSISQKLSDGFFAIAFESSASNLTTLATPLGQNNIFVHLPTLGITEIISSGVGFTAGDGTSYLPSVTAALNKSNRTKVLVAFSSTSTNLTTDTPNGQLNVYLSELLPPASKAAGYDPTTFVTTKRISNSAISGQELDGSSFSARISADGRYIVFASRASNLVSPQLPTPNYNSQIYRYDTETNTTVLVSADSSGAVGDNDSIYPEISYNGRYIAYLTYASNLGTGTPASIGLNVMRYDAQTNTTIRVNQTAEGVTGIGVAPFVAISPNGRLVAFADDSSSLVAGDADDATDIFIKDLETETIKRVSNGAGGTEPNGASTSPSLTADTLSSLTSSVGFQSLATNLTNPAISDGVSNIYVVDVALPVPPVTRDTRIDVPPDVTVTRKQLKFTAQKFTLPPATSASDGRTVQYEWNVRGKVTIKKKTQTFRNRTITKRNTLTLTKQRKSNYRVSNRVLVVDKKGKVKLRTPFSPTQQLAVK